MIPVAQDSGKEELQMNNDTVQGSREDNLYDFKPKKISRETRAFTFNITVLEIFLDYCYKNKIKASAIVNQLLTDYVENNIPAPQNSAARINLNDPYVTELAYYLFYEREFIASVNRIFATRVRNYKNERKSNKINKKMSNLNRFEEGINYSNYLLKILQDMILDSNFKKIINSKRIDPYIKDLNIAKKILEKRKL